MIPYKVYDHISLGPVNLQVWGLLVSLAFVVGIIIVYFEAKKKNIEAAKIIDLALWIILGSVVGARLLYVLNELDLFIESPLDIFKVWQGGFMMYGGFAGALIGGLIYLKRKKLDFWKYADAVIFSLPLGIFIGRIGCFLIHDHMGKLTTVPWGIQYLDGIRHETSIYTSLSGLVLFIIFLIFKKTRFSKIDGFYTVFFMIWYGVSRFIIDFYRAADLPFSDPRWGGLTPSQYLSIFLVILGAYIWIKLRKSRQSLMIPETS